MGMFVGNNGGNDGFTPHSLVPESEDTAQTQTIDAVPVVHGRWVMRGGRFRCSECDTKALWRDTGGTGGFSHEFEQAKTCACPSCFARMDGEEAQQCGAK